MVTCIHQQHIPAGVLDALFQGSNGGIGGLGGLVVDIGVDIVGVEDGHIRFVTKEAIGLLRKGGGCTDRNCGQCRGSTGSLDKAAAGNELFHRERPPFYLGCSRGEHILIYSLTQFPIYRKRKL